MWFSIYSLLCSGRLPYTIGKAITDYSAQVLYVDETVDIAQIPYTEGIFIDYRHFDAVSHLIFVISDSGLISYPRPALSLDLSSDSASRIPHSTTRT